MVTCEFVASLSILSKRDMTIDGPFHCKMITQHVNLVGRSRISDDSIVYIGQGS
jgi:hypothetical protein